MQPTGFRYTELLEVVLAEFQQNTLMVSELLDAMSSFSTRRDLFLLSGQTALLEGSLQNNTFMCAIHQVFWGLQKQQELPSTLDGSGPREGKSMHITCDKCSNAVEGA